MNKKQIVLEAKKVSDYFEVRFFDTDKKMFLLPNQRKITKLDFQNLLLNYYEKTPELQHYSHINSLMKQIILLNEM